LPQNLAAGVYLVQIPELRKTFKVLIDWGKRLPRQAAAAAISSCGIFKIKVS
jgi:hypothetical protein